jgi:hypothetical protein
MYYFIKNILSKSNKFLQRSILEIGENNFECQLHEIKQEIIGTETFKASIGKGIGYDKVSSIQFACRDALLKNKQ